MRRDEQLRHTRRGRRAYATASSALLLLVLALPGAAGAQGWTTSGDNISNTNTGNVGVGNSSPLFKLTVGDPARQDGRVAVEGNDNGTNFLFNTAGANRGRITTLPNGLHFQAYSGAWQRNDLFIRNDGNVGVGNMSPGSKLTVGDPTKYDGRVAIESNDDNTSILFNTGGANRGRILTRADGLHFQSYSGGWQRNDLFVRNDGNVGVGTIAPAARLDVAGDLNASGTVRANNVVAKYQDVAEWVPSSQRLAAGTVVVLDPGRVNHVLGSTRPYDTRVAGVVSAQPGVILGEGGEGKLMVATTGRVKVNVDATRSPILVGDLLVTGDREGVAMKSQPLDLGGVPIHRPGTIIGKALEPLDRGTGQILVLLSLQ